MTSDDPPPAAVLVVRAWFETADPDHLRARLWWAHRLTDEPLRERSVGSMDELRREVTGWLDGLTEAG